MRFFIPPSADHLRPRLEALGATIGAWEAFRFADGERGYRLSEQVSGETVAVVGSVLPDPASLFDLIALERLLVENGGRHPALIIPYLGYARQDRPARSGEGSLGVVVAGRRVLIIDDMIDTGGTLCEAVRLLVTNGATRIRVAATHGIFSHDARERILRLPVDQLIVTNSLPQPEHARIEVLDIAPVLLEALSQSAGVPTR